MRALIFGVDGLSFRVLHPMMQAGYLPNFQALACQGMEAVLESKYPPLTPPAWMSLVTGLRPAGHGVYDFWEYNEQGGDRLMTKRKDGQAIWNILSNYGKRVIVVNVPLTYPPDPVNGILVSGIQGPNERGNFTYPSTFREELLSKVPGYRIDVDVTSVVHGKMTPVQAAVQLIEGRSALMRFLLDEKEWDFAFITFCASDYLQHLMWENIQALDPEVMRYYRLLDEALGYARAKLGSDGTLFVVSDHGFQGAGSRFAINEYLYRQKWLRGSRTTNRSKELVHALGKAALNRLGLLQWGRGMKDRLFLPAGQPLTKQSPFLSRQEQLSAGVSVASWSCSSAAYADLCITRTMSEQEMADLCGQLLEITDPANGHRLVDAVFGTEVFGRGPFAPHEQHLLLLPTEGYTFTPVLGQPYLWERERHLAGTHQKDGVLYACGPNIKVGERGQSAEIYDVVPTVLRAMDLPLPGNLDGRVIEDIFISSTQPTAERPLARSTVAHKLKQLQGS